ncbi:MAG: hypothetical protein JSW47_07600, partial [Phycisphaerales bacterium]
SLTAICWSPDGGLLACGDSTGKIRVYDSNSGRWQRSFSTECGSIFSLTWSANRRVLLCGGSEGIVRGWDALRHFEEHVILLPLSGATGPGVAVSAAGDYRGPPGLADHFVYAVQTAEAQMKLSQADFKSQYGWVNEPWQVGLYKPGAEKVERIYVNATSEGPYDGKTWETAFNDLQDALSIAQQNTEIWVAAGVYVPDRGTGARTASFRLKNGVRLLGGFTGKETSSDQRDPNTNETILSGDLKGDDGPDFVNNDENSYHVVVALKIYPDTVLDGFIITGGNANDPREDQPQEGAGLYSTAHALTLINCIFKSKSAGNEGGGMYHKSDSSSLSLTGCIFSNNRTANYPNSHGWGGGVLIAGVKGFMKKCVFYGNLANEGGGARLIRTAGLVLQDCAFIGNRAAKRGGGINCGFGSPTTAYSLLNCRFIGNSARGGGAIFNRDETKATLVNCIFVSNTARDGAGGMSHVPGEKSSSHARLTNCIFIANSARNKIGGFFTRGENGATLSNCILWSNADRDGSSESAQIQGERIVVNHCCIQGWTEKLGGTGNFGADPTFVDINGPDDIIGTEDDNLRLKFGSPCINAGDNSAIPVDEFDLDDDGDTEELIPFDLDGQPRIINGTVDIGAYESN